MTIRFFASPIVAAFFVLNCWAQNAPAGTPPPHSFRQRFTTLTDSDSRPWTAEQLATMGCIRDAAMTDPNAYNMVAHLTDNNRSAAQWFAAGSGRWRMGSCQDAGDGHDRHARENNCSSLGTRQGRRGLNRVAGNVANVIVVSSFAELRRLPLDDVKGKIVLFNKSSHLGF
jgi:carboxypeptidase Q